MGLGGQLTDWPDGFVDELVGAGFQVTVYDNRDIGLSTEFDWEPPKQVKAVLGSLAKRPPKAGYTIPDMAADADGLLDALGIDSAHVVGMSMGGMIAQQLTIDHPSRVRSLTSIMSNPGDGKSGRIAAKVMAKMARMPEPTLENAADRSVASFQLWSSPHFDPEEHRARSQRSIERSFRPVGTQRQTTAIMASPDRTPGLGDGQRAHARDPWPRRHAREAERWDRHGGGRSRCAAADVPGHGPRPPAAQVGRDDRSDPAERRSSRRGGSGG